MKVLLLIPRTVQIFPLDTFNKCKYTASMIFQEWLSSVPSAVAPPPDPVSEENHASEELTSEEDESDDDIELSQQH